MVNPIHFYYFVNEHRYTHGAENGEAQNVFVAACQGSLFETREYWATHIRPEGFSFGTENKENVTCGNCRKTKRFKMENR